MLSGLSSGGNSREVDDVVKSLCESVANRVGVEQLQRYPPYGRLLIGREHSRPRLVALLEGARDLISALEESPNKVPTDKTTGAGDQNRRHSAVTRYEPSCPVTPVISAVGM
jgi:hypothetical protein